MKWVSKPVPAVRIAVSAVILCLISTPPAPADAPAAGKSPGFKTVTLRVGHRVFPNWSEDHTVALREGFQIGDSEMSAEVIRYEPDFAIIGRTKKISSRTSEPNNPAFQIVVYESDAPRDTTWAFLNMPPHFSTRSTVAFKVMRIDFQGRKPLVNRDTTAVKLPAPAAGGGHP